MRKHEIKLFALLLIGGLLPLHVYADQAPILKVAATSVTSHFHPVLMRGKDDIYLREFIHGRLISPDEKWQFSCNFCEQIPLLPTVKSKNEKARAKTEATITWRIKKDAKWGNGTPITGWDIRFGFEIFQASRVISKTGNRSSIRSIIVNDQDASEFTIHLHSATSDYLIDLDFPLLPASIEEPIWIGAEKNIDKYLNNSEYEKNPLNPALYCGCYLPTSKHNDGIALSPNKHCVKGTPHFSGIRTVSDRGNWRDILTKSSVDLIPETLITPDSVEVLQSHFQTPNSISDAYSLVSGPDGSIEFLVFNLRNPAFADRKVRQALAHAIDTKSLAMTAKISLDPPVGVLPAGYLPTSDAAWPYEANAAAAQAIFKQLRWKADSKGILHRDGKALKLELIISDSPANRHTIAQEIQKMLKEVGVDLGIKVVDDHTFRNSVFARSKFSDMLLLRWQFIPGVIPFSILHSSQIPGVENDYNGQNIAGIFSKKIDDQLANWAEEKDPAKHGLIRQEINQLFVDEIYAIPLLQRPQSAIVSKSLKNFQLTGHPRPSSSLVAKWRWEPHQAK